MQTEALQRCDNCLKDYPQSKMATHFGYCRRNIKRCEICREMYDINFKEDHDEEFHKRQKCNHCKKEFSSADFKSHERDCLHKPKFCEYCELNVPASGFSTHFKECQSRTKPCAKCNRPVMNKDYLVHLIGCNGITEPPKQVQKNQGYSDYNNFINQQRRRDQPNINNHTEKLNSRQKISVIKPKEERNYAQINKKPQQVRYDQRIVHEPRFINQPINQNKYDVKPQYERRESTKPPTSIKQQYRKQEPKKEEILPKRYTGVLNPPSYNRREQLKTNNIKPTGPASNEHLAVKRTTNSRQVIKPVSNKEIFPVQNFRQQPVVKQNKSIQRGIVRKQPNGGIDYGIRNNNVKPSYEPQRHEPQKYQYQKYEQRVPQNRPKMPSPRHQAQYNPSQYDLQGYQMTPQQQQMQEIIMQSMKDQHAAKSGKNNMRNYKPASNQLPEDYMNESFIEKQKAIEEEIRYKRK